MSGTDSRNPHSPLGQPVLEKGQVLVFYFPSWFRSLWLTLLLERTQGYEPGAGHPRRQCAVLSRTNRSRHTVYGRQC